MHSDTLRRWRAGRVLATGAIAVVVACTPDISTKRNPPERGTLGQELYGVLCDRVGAQALREDLTGASFRQLCHPAVGAFADSVDTRLLPPLAGGGITNPTRAHAIARIEALARRRADLIAALDATFPDIRVPAKNLKDGDPTRTCNPAGDDRFINELSDLLDRLQAQGLYTDGTLPASTESLGRLFNAFQADGDFQSVLARLEARKGYRPPDLAVGAARPLLGYPRLRDLNNATLRLISADSNPFNPNPPRDASGKRIPEPGAAYGQLSKLLEIAHEELRTAEADPPVDPLVVTRDVALGREVLSRPRTNAEMLQEIALVQDLLLGGGSPQYIVRRDRRGLALVALVNGSIPAPFVDRDGDKLADVDELGQFVTTTGTPAPTPFPAPDEKTGTSRDGFGRATADGRLLHEYIDTSHTLAAALLDDLKPLANPDPSQQHETLMDSLAGLQPLFGSRDGSNRTSRVYRPPNASPVSVAYDAFHPEDSPLLDLVYAAGQIMGDRTNDDTLALVRQLFAEHPHDLARLVSAALKAKDIANHHPEATLSPTSVFWDEMIAVAVRIAQVPGLLEDVFAAMGSDDALPVGKILANQMKYKDLVSYDRGFGRPDCVQFENGSCLNAQPLSYFPGPIAGINLSRGGRAFPEPTPHNPVPEWYQLVDRGQPDTGTNRSFFQRYIQLIHDSHGAATCNKQDSRLYIHNLCSPTAGCMDTEYPLTPAPAMECEIFRIRDVAKFYLDAIVGQAQNYLRMDFLRTSQSVQLFEDSSGIHGFWPTAQGQDTRPRPQYLNRLVFFDLANDSPSPGDLNYLTNHFISFLAGPNVGTSVCPERSIPDPYALLCPPFCPTDMDADGMIHGLRTCASGDWLAQRDNNILFAFEQVVNFPDGTMDTTYRALRPLVSAFVNRGQEELFISLLEVLNRHWQDDRGVLCRAESPPGCECDPMDRTVPPDGRPPMYGPRYCSQDGLVRSEPMLSEILATDLLPALANLNKILAGIIVQHCNAVDPTTHLCTSHTPMSGVAVLAESTRALIDPARNAGLTDRRQHQTTTWNDGSTVVPQVTPLYLVTDAIKAMDQVLAAAPDRKAQWERARSQLVDEFLEVTQNSGVFSFARRGLPRIVTTSVDVIRAQLLAKCPTSFTPPFFPCDWARNQIVSDLSDAVQGPLFAATQDLTEAIRQDQPARTETEKLLQYLFDSSSEVRPALLASLADVLQLANDQADYIPLLHALAPAVASSFIDETGARQTSLVDSQTALLTRAAGRAFNPDNVEICSLEVDPNEVLTTVLRQTVTPITLPGKVPQTPLEIFLDVISDVNRAEPGQTDKLKLLDYASIFEQVGDFLLSKDHGMEQFYEIVRQGSGR